MKRALLILALLLVAAAPAAANTATKAVRSANETMSKLLRTKAKPDKVTTSLRGFLDIDELGKLALVDHWKDLTEKQQTEYLALLRSLIEANYIKGLKANLEYKVDYVGEEQRDDDTVVNTEIKTKRKGRPIVIAIDYVLRKQGKGWRAVDVVTDGVGLVENYRAQFNRIIKKEGFDGLLERMRNKLEQTKS